MIKRVTLLIATLFISGCTDFVEQVKAQVFPMDQTYTWAQALDNRESCEASRWTSTRDDAGRDFVEHRCRLAGIRQALAAKKAAEIEEVEFEHKRSADYAARSLADARNRPADLQQRVQYAQAKLDQALTDIKSRADSADTAAMAKIEAWRSEKVKLQNMRTVDELVEAVDSRSLSGEALDAFILSVDTKRLKTARKRGDRELEAQAVRILKGRGMAAIHNLDEAIARTKVSLEAAQRYRRQAGESSEIQNARQKLVRAQENLESGMPNVDRDIAEKTKEREAVETAYQSKLAAIEAKYADIRAVTEFFRWIILPNDRVQLERAGLEIDRKGGQQRILHNAQASSFSLLKMTAVRDAEYAKVALAGF